MNTDERRPKSFLELDETNDTQTVAAQKEPGR